MPTYINMHSLIISFCLLDLRLLLKNMCLLKFLDTLRLSYWSQFYIRINEINNTLNITQISREIKKNLSYQVFRVIEVWLIDGDILKQCGRTGLDRYEFNEKDRTVQSIITYGANVPCKNYNSRLVWLFILITQLTIDILTTI